MRRLALLPLALAAACAGPRAAPPEAAQVTPPERWRGTGGSEPVTADWWTRFGDPALDDLVEHVMANNVDIALAATRVEEARARVRLTEGAQLPSVGLGTGGGEQREVDFRGLGVTQWAAQVQGSVSYDLDLFGRLANASAAARAQLLGTEAARDNVRLAVASTTASLYIQLRALDARIAILEDTLTVRGDSLKLVRRRADAGYATQLEVRQAEAEYHAAEQAIPATRIAVQRLESALSVLMGGNPHAIWRGKPLMEVALPPVPGVLPADLLRRRPDIAQAEAQVVAADRSLDAARAAFMPQVQLGATGGVVAAELLADPVTVFSVGGSLLAPIFQGGRLRAQADIATAQRDQAAYGYLRTTITAFGEVEDALAAISNGAAQEAALRAQREAQAAALENARKRYAAGYSAYLEQLDAQRGLLGADLALVQVRADRLAALVQLYRAAGGGWGS